jgi:hypothetical protein
LVDLFLTGTVGTVGLLEEVIDLDSMGDENMRRK